MRVLITGGAGFVGSSLACKLRAEPSPDDVIAFDNLHRRGAELNLPRFKSLGIQFAHGDVRSATDLDALPGNFDLMIEASAEPSVLAGLQGSPAYVMETNLSGTLNCLEFARKRCHAVLFLSTSRVYSIDPLRRLALREAATRFELEPTQAAPGVTAAGISETFPLHLPRSLYGASKLASEYIVQEYAYAYGLKAVINRCGVIAGPGQFGKVDQGVFTLWVANHYFGLPLRYTGFGGTGKQVRDLLAPDDLYELIRKQLAVVDKWSGDTYNVGGGHSGSVSLQELTVLCQQVTGRNIPIGSDPDSTMVDIPLYISDHRKVSQAFDWRPRTTPEMIVRAIADWIGKNESVLRGIFAENERGRV